MKRVLHMLSIAILVATLVGCRSGGWGMGFCRDQAPSDCCGPSAMMESPTVTYQEGSTVLVPPAGATVLPAPANN